MSDKEKLTQAISRHLVNKEPKELTMILNFIYAMEDLK